MNAPLEKLTAGEGKTQTRVAFAKAWDNTSPMLCDKESYPKGKGFVRGLVKVETQDGKPVRIVWTADQ